MRKGFTLLELLITITIFALVAASVYTSLYLGIKVSRNEEQNDMILEESLLSLEIISRDLRCAFINPQNDRIKFSGSKDALDFFTVSPQGDIENVGFYLQAGASEGLFELLRFRKQFLKSAEEEDSLPELINQRVAAISLSYFNAREQKWYEEWPAPAELPGQVRIAASFGREPRALVKYVHIPAAGGVVLPDESQ